MVRVGSLRFESRPRAGASVRHVRLICSALGVSAATAVVWYLLLPTGVVYAPLWTQMVGWPLVLLMRSETVQRLLGGGRLDNQVWLRTHLGCSVCALALSPTGMLFLFPLFATMVASVHVQWTGSRAWRASAVSTLVVTAALQGAVHLGWQRTALPVGVGDVSAVIALITALVTIANIAVLAARREADAAALNTERNARHEELVLAATHDSLTGLLNRAGLYERLGEALEGARPEAGIALLYFDLDGFKQVNDRYGHSAGDRLIQLTAQRLVAVLRPGDHVARMGGDEFVAVLVDVDEPNAVAAVAARADAALAVPFDLTSAMVTISASIGTALTHDPSQSIDDLVHRADEAMYARKGTRSSSTTDRMLTCAVSPAGH